MDAVVDSSTLISLAWSGLLSILDRCPIDLVLPEPVYQETVADGLAGGHPDAAAIETAVKDFQRLPVEAVETVDAAVLEAAREVGVLVTNDVTLGRRATNVGVRWLRTADLVVLAVRAGRLAPAAGTDALKALHSAGRIMPSLLDAYLEELS